MAITYTLTPLSMSVAPTQSGQQNVVVNVLWEYTATDGVYVANSGPGNTFFTYSSKSSFTPYNQLTQAQVAGWVTSSWTPAQTALYQKQLADNLATQQAAQYATPPLPWS